MTADNTKEWADKILASLKCPNKDCGVECGIDDYECSRCNTHLLPLASIRTRKYIDQLRRDAVLDYIVKDTKQKEHSYQLGLQKGRIEAKKELLDYDLYAQDEIRRCLYLMKDCQPDSHLFINGYDRLEKIADELLNRAKTLRENGK